MAASAPCFVEWKEQFVSKERGNRVVHYFLKDILGESILAVVGTERSVRHMFYVVSEEFLNVNVPDSSIHAGYRWRSRREVVNWLTSMLSKQHRQGDHSKSPKNDPMFGLSPQQSHMPEYKGRLARSFKGQASDIVWSGVAWTCGKQLKHYPAFCRNGITIAIHSFVFVMAEEENHHLAYLEDMYEDRKGQKKVKVRWFHHNQEVKGVVSIRNPHPKEVFITPYAQVISAECVDGSATVLTRDHYEESVADIPRDMLNRVHLCFRQFKSNRVKPFKLSKLRGYYDQPIFSCLDPDFVDEEFSPGDNVRLGAKRTRSGKRRHTMPYEPSCQNLKYDMPSRRVITRKYIECQPYHSQLIKANEKIELLCQDSGIRGCWFRCTVLQISQRQIKVQYDDVKDEDGCGSLEEWIPAFRQAMPDKLGMRYSGRPTIRPAPPQHETDLAFGVGAPVDAWWSDGWWEGIVTRICNSEDEHPQVYIPSENLLLTVNRKNLRVSRDWAGDRWVDVRANPNILSAISTAIIPDAKLSLTSMISVDPKSDGFPTLCNAIPTNTKLSMVEEEKLEVAGLASDIPPTDMECTKKEKLLLVEDNGDGENNGSHEVDCHEKDSKGSVHDTNDDEGNNNVDLEDSDGENKLEMEQLDISGQRCDAELVEVMA
ncbi:hypothetical protein RJ639_023809 [Escallonia herrerae]|uniref:BAH domain-containing protein n=1 Tax=Escallonia herrerae TaxID=1293975 RepID=A0AA88V0U9_9ASTE|nr:hypothetical protein RJ639_023809 [Escallonia herrerae]